MPDQILIGNFAKGLTTNRLPFVIDNDAFPQLYNAYVWRGRARRKRGTALLGRLTRQVKLISPTKNWEYAPLTLSGGTGNLISNYSLGSQASIVPRSISLTVGGNTYTEPSTPNGNLVGSPSGTGTINYATGAITIAGGGSSTVSGTFSYYPSLPVLGQEDYMPNPSSGNIGSPYPLSLQFDQKYAYQINQNGGILFYGIGYYKSTNNPVVWSGTDYQQFWSTNYQSAFWATNNKPGLHFVNGTYTSISGTKLITMNLKSGGVNYTTLVDGDQIWFNEWAGSTTINGVVGTVSTNTDAANGNYVITFNDNQTVSGTGIGQLLTSSISGQDGIRWYDGDPTSGTGIPTSTTTGWVNFAPPLTQTAVEIDDETAALYYLVGAQAIVPFKDRLLFFGPWIQTSNGAPIPLQDTVIWSWNGTPYYTTFDSASTLPYAPSGEVANIGAYLVDASNGAGWLAAGISQPIVTINNNEDVLLVGFTGRETRFIYTGNDFDPFAFFSINSEIGSSATFSGITLDKGGVTIGTYGIAMTTQYSTERIDLQIPDAVFDIQASNNGANRVNAARDFFKEWIYFSYPVNNSLWKFPTQTFLWNYRDNTWGVFYENFTAHGTFRYSSGYTWATIPYTTWNVWNEPWNSAVSTAQFPSVIAGTPQGFVLVTGVGTAEAPSGAIAAISTNGANTQITSTNHCVEVGDYLYFLNCIGSTYLNTQIGRVITTVDANNFVVDILFQSGTYTGLGTFTRLSQPLIQTKQFPVYWEEGRQVRLGTQKYLMDYTDNAQVTLNIYLSQDPDNVYNSGSIVPITDPEPTNNSLIYSQVLFTSPEPNNLQTLTASNQYQIWHRVSTSLQGDTVQIGITLNDAQMRNLDYATAEITLNAMQLTVYKGPLVC